MPSTQDTKADAALAAVINTITRQPNNLYATKTLAGHVRLSDDSNVNEWKQRTTPAALAFHTLDNTAVNLNDYRWAGEWMISRPTTATNFPTTGTWTGTNNGSYLKVTAHRGDQQGTQTLYGGSQNALWFRSFTATGTFSAWKRIPLLDEPTASGQVPTWNGSNIVWQTPTSGGGNDSITLVDNAASSTLIAVAAKTVTQWLQGIRDNLKYLFETKEFVARATSVSLDGKACTVQKLDASGNPAGTLYSNVKLPNNVNGWTSRTSAANNEWRSICYSEELKLFVAVASTGTNRVMRSLDGMNWTIVTSAPNNNWNSVCYSKKRNLFVAVGNTGNNRAMTSSDGGATWTARQAATDNWWYSICYGDGTFVAVAQDGSGNRVMTNDGKSVRYLHDVLERNSLVVETSGNYYLCNMAI
jgi:hypothetical protein